MMSRAPNPTPKASIKIRATIEHGACWYVGDTVDDARAASAAGVPFIGIAAPRQPALCRVSPLTAAPKEPVAVLDDINSWRDASHTETDAPNR